MKKYKIEKLMVLTIYKYDSKTEKGHIYDYKVTTKRRLKHKHLGDSLSYVKAIDGTEYPMDSSFSYPFVGRINTFFDCFNIEYLKKENIKTVDIMDIALLQETLYNQWVKPKTGGNIPTVEVEDLF